MQTKGNSYFGYEEGIRQFRLITTKIVITKRLGVQKNRRYNFTLKIERTINESITHKFQSLSIIFISQFQ